jgi:hypothetical protein
VTERGQQTEDLHQHTRTPPPGRDETRDRRYSRRALTAGITLGATTYVASLIAAVASDQGMFASRPAQLFGILGLVLLSNLAGALVVLGGTVVQLRSVNVRIDAAAVEAARLRQQVASGAEDNRERFDVLMGLLGPVAGRLDQVAESVGKLEHAVAATPGYATGVEHGLKLRKDLIGGTAGFDDLG